MSPGPLLRNSDSEWPKISLIISLLNVYSCDRYHTVRAQEKHIHDRHVHLAHKVVGVAQMATNTSK